jgi:glycerol-3-phosphate dehydrogenase
MESNEHKSPTASSRKPADNFLGASLDARYRVIILGGGIHGVGVAHDLASRGWKDVLVVEKSILGSGTSSKSTKLIHGGLRYLQHPRDFPLVAEGLEERAFIGDQVVSAEFLFTFIFY